jgi:hypothetical protein
MRNALRWHFWLETSMALVTGILFVITLVQRDWIEIVFGVDPDSRRAVLQKLMGNRIGVNPYLLIGLGGLLPTLGAQSPLGATRESTRTLRLEQVMREPSTAELIAASLLQKLIEPQGEPAAAQWNQAEREALVPGSIVIVARRLL